MKKAIHPVYHSDAKATCVCGASFTVGSTQKDMHLDICSQCHPFYTGNAKMMDTAVSILMCLQQNSLTLILLTLKVLLAI